MIRADLHVHTTYSMDCAVALDRIISRCLEVGIDCIAVADHATTAGAIELKRSAPFKVIVAEEILTPLGEIMGMFLTETIPSPMPPDEAIAHIRSQGGLVCIPHPFDRARSALEPETLENLIRDVDLIEAFNSRTLFPGRSNRARLLADKYNIPCSAGSDAHTAPEIGNAFVEMPDFQDKAGFLASLREGKIVGRKASPLVHLASTRAKFTKHRSRR